MACNNTRLNCNEIRDCDCLGKHFPILNRYQVVSTDELDLLKKCRTLNQGDEAYVLSTKKVYIFEEGKFVELTQTRVNP